MSNNAMVSGRRTVMRRAELMAERIAPLGPGGGGRPPLSPPPL
jgi:hypothetical protein